MSNRSANAAIKGYLYQFDHTIVQLLSASSKDMAVTVEGLEDIDLEDGDDSVLIQCKYFEGTSYNHSVIKDAIIEMVRHFHSNGCNASKNLKYRVYGHYKDGQDKLPACVSVDFLKQHFLTFTSEKISHQVHVELLLNDSQLQQFLNVLEINVRGVSYERQQGDVENLLISNISDCTKEDVATFFYPLAIHTLQKLAITKDEDDRRITKSQFLDEVNKKETVFSNWLRRMFGNEYYARLIKRKLFPYRSTKISKAARVFIIDVTSEFNVAKLAALLGKIGARFSHVEHRRTPVQDRFCPYIFLRGLNRDELIQLKEQLVNLGIKIFDGHTFDGAAFSPLRLAAPPTKDNLIKLKFIAFAEQLNSVISSISDTPVEIFEFFKDAPVASTYVTSPVPHHKIKIDTAFFISEVI